MTKSPEARAAYQVRREQRLARIKTATAMMAALQKAKRPEGEPWSDHVELLATAAVEAADALLAEVERTAPAEEVAG